MAERFGGRYSPGASGQAGGAGPQSAPQSASPPPRLRRGRAGGRVNFLFLMPFFFAGRAFFQDPAGLLRDLGAFAVLFLAAWLTREGLLAQEAYEARRVARRPAIPRKIFGAVLTGAGLALGGWGWAADGGAAGLAAPVIFGLLGAGLHLAAFGLDPLRDKGVEGVDRHQSGRVARAVDEAERHLAAMAEAVRATGDRALIARVARFQDTARAMFRTVEADPRDLTAARRYLGVYLLGARDAATKYADLRQSRDDPEARAAFTNLLDDLESNFAARTRSLLQNDRSDLDVEIEVLRERLAREGLRDVDT